MTRQQIEERAQKNDAYEFVTCGQLNQAVELAIEISNAALSEAIEKIKVFYHSHYMGPEKDILEILEGLKIKP